MGWPNNYVQGVYDATGKVVGVGDGDGGEIGLANLFSVVTYGADKTGVADSTSAMVACAAAVMANGGGVYYIPTGTYILKSSVVLPVNSHLYFEMGAFVKTASGGVFTANAAFLMNTVNGTSWVDDYPYLGKMKATNVWVDNTISPSLQVGALITAGACEVTNIIGRYCWFTHKDVGAYSDHKRIQGIFAEENQDASNYAIVYNIGDGLTIDNLSGGKYASSPTDKTVKVYASSGGSIRGAIWSGEINLSSCRAFTVENGHGESSRIAIDNSSVAIKNTYFWKNAGSPNIIATTSSEGQTWEVDNVKFMSFYNLPATINLSVADIQLALGVQLSVKNSFRVNSSSGAVGRSQEHGIYLNKYDGSPLTEWNDLSWLLSRDGLVTQNYKVVLNHVSPSGTNTPNISSLQTNSAVTWGEASGTYYYAMQLIYDRNRMTGVSCAAYTTNNATVSNGGNGVLLVLGFDDRPAAGWVRMFRGTTNSTTDYTHYCDVPCVNVLQMFDQGMYLNGYPWVARTAAAKDTVYSLPANQYIEWKGRLVHVSGHSAIPTVGTWVVGDRITSTTLTTGTPQGWVCSVAGTPGTWKAMPNHV